VAVDAAGNYVYVADTGNNQVQKFTARGTFESAWGTTGSENGEFTAPSGVTVDSAGNVYVADSGNSRIQKFTVSGNTATFVTAWGTNGAGNGQFDTPVGVAVAGAGNVYVADTLNGRIQRFDAGWQIGDVNSDDNVNVFDALLVLQYAVGLTYPSDEATFKLVADVAPLDANGKPKGDGVVNVFDALSILRHAVGLDGW
jgi:DNA-binding beta-propeller fold protein YncE